LELEKNDAWVGLFVLISVLVIVGTLIAIAEGRFGEATPLIARFDAISAIQEGTPVILRGYRVGEVKKIDFVSEPEIHFDVHFAIAREVRLRRGARAVITSTNMIGENYVLLDVAAANGDTLKAGEVIPGDSAGQLSDLMGRVNGVLSGAQHTVDRLAAVLRSSDSAEGADAAARTDRVPLAELTQATIELRDLLATLNRVATASQPHIAETSALASGELRTAQWTTAQAGSLMAENREKIGDLIANLDTTTKSMNDLVVELHGIAHDNRDQIAGTVTELEKTSANLARISGDLADHPWKLLFR